ncbi:MAG TPA: hypothetical protein VME43_03775 [Bryobacteraceae bacterium]|nr:hypothetical protein [Bryobacteraceae bacterium]
MFENSNLVDDVVREIEALGLPRKEVRILEEPLSFDVTGVMSFPRLDYEVSLVRELTRIGATEAEAEAYLQGLRRGGALVFATGSDQTVEGAATIMNRHGAVQIEKASGSEPDLPTAGQEIDTPMLDTSILTGRIRQSGGGAAFFVW